VRIAADGSHHIYRGKALYAGRFLKVLSFHSPGVAAVADRGGAFHIDLTGNPCYNGRFLETFGYYQGVAAVLDETGYFHIDLSGNPVYAKRYSWVGNFQEDRAPVKDAWGNCFHITKEGVRAYVENYRYCGDFKHGIAVAYDSKGRAHHIDYDGKRLNADSYLSLLPFHKDVAVAEDDNGFFHVDKNGRSLYGHRYRWLEPYYNGFALAQEFGGRLGTRNERGKWVHTIREPDSSSEADASLFEVEVRPFEPLTKGKSKNNLARKERLREEIQKSLGQVGTVSEKFGGKPVIVKVSFFLWEGTKHLPDNRSKKDLDNLVKPVLDVLQETLDADGKHGGLGLIKGDVDVFRLEATKAIVHSIDDEGIRITIRVLNQS